MSDKSSQYSDSESSGSEISVDGLYYSSDSSATLQQSASGYMNEPEYTESELKKLQPDDIVSENSDNVDDDLDSSRMDNLHWCQCKSHCVILHTVVECKCCRECEKLLNSKLKNIDCITQHEEFLTLCLNKTVLETAYILHRRRNRIFKEFDKMSNK